MKRQVGMGAGCAKKPGDDVFSALKKLYMSKGHGEDEAWDLAFEALEMLEDWYDEKMGEAD